MGKKTLICSAMLVLVSALTGAAFGQGIKDSFSAGLPGNSPISIPEGKSLSGGSVGQRIIGTFSPGRPEITIESMSAMKASGQERANQSDVDYGVQLTQTRMNKWYTDWSPDGKWITYAEIGEDGLWDVWIIPAEGGEPINLTDNIDGNCIFPNFTHDSSAVCFDNGNRSLDKINITTMEHSVILKNFIHISWSHNGRYFAYRVPETADLAVFDTSNNSSWIIAEASTALELFGDNAFSLSCFTPDDSHIITTLYDGESMKLFKIPVEGGGN